MRSLRSLRGDPVTAPVTPTVSGIAYRPGGPLADIYVPEGARASVVLVHGGAFVIGSRRMKPMRYLVAQLTAARLAVLAIDYRMIFRGGRLAEATDDVVDAFAFWAEQAPTFGLDPARISMVGLSAGATLSLLAGARCDGLAALVSCFGLYEVDHLHGPATVFPRLLFATGDRAAWTARSPRHAPQAAAPTLLLHGTDDGLVPAVQAERLAAHRVSQGLPTRLVIYEGAPHGFFNLAHHPAAEAAVREIVEHAYSTATSASASGPSRSSTK
ncbi:MAG TPA: alpha/beta hydrolase [Kofleriaceae bacterium]|nr:alpha/beta hydrolase [Kofleriaceae bacterium]